MQVRSPGWEDPLEKETGTHSRILAWNIPWTEEPSGLQPLGWQSLIRQSTHTSTLGGATIPLKRFSLGWDYTRGQLDLKVTSRVQSIIKGTLDGKTDTEQTGALFLSLRGSLKRLCNSVSQYLPITPWKTPRVTLECVTGREVVLSSLFSCVLWLLYFFSIVFVSVIFYVSLCREVLISTINVTPLVYLNCLTSLPFAALSTLHFYYLFQCLN